MAALPSWLVNGMATLGGLGRIGPAPGTLGSAAGTVFYALVMYRCERPLSFAITLLLLIAGVFFCDEAEIRMNKSDPGCVILDEFAVMPLVFMGLHWPNATWQMLLVLIAGFLLFRVFDILKPFGISRIQELPGGLGVMADDIVAALVSCLLLHAVLAVGRLLF